MNYEIVSVNSEEKDKLSLWRGYGNEYNSVVVGYDVANLKTDEKK